MSSNYYGSIAGEIADDGDGEDWECDHEHDEECYDYQGFYQCQHQHCMNCGGCRKAGPPSDSRAEQPAHTLRRAAKLMRERAEAAPPSPWRTGEGVGGYPKLILNEDGPFAAAEWTMAQSWPAAGDYVTSMHPGVALALADWLEAEAADAGPFPLRFPQALAVARAYLGILESAA